jgi:hypothetical protein
MNVPNTRPEVRVQQISTSIRFVSRLGLLTTKSDDIRHRIFASDPIGLVDPTVVRLKHRSLRSVSEEGEYSSG